MSSRDLSVQSHSSSRLSKCYLALLAVFTLLLMKGAVIPEKVSGCTHSVYFMPSLALMYRPAEGTLSRGYGRSSPFIPLRNIHGLLFSGCSPSWACSLPSRKVTERISLMGCVLDGITSRRP